MILILIILSNLLGNTLATSEVALKQNDNQLVSTLIQSSSDPECSRDGFEDKRWANDVIRGNFAPGYENQFLDESTNKGENPELDARQEIDQVCDRLVENKYIFHRGIAPLDTPNNCSNWFKFYQTDPCGLKPKACTSTRRGKIKISREKTGGFMWHAAGYGCKDWTWSKVFWKPRLWLGEFLTINIPDQDGPTINESQIAGTYSCLNTCGLQPAVAPPKAPVPTANDVKPLSINADGPLYWA